MYAVLMAGGSGKRLWPLATEAHGKPFLRPSGRESLLELAYQHARALTRTTSQIFVATHKAFAPLVRTHIPKLPDTQIIVEPEARDTAAALAFAIANLLARGAAPDDTLIQLPGDSLVTNVSAYRRALRLAIDLVQTFPDSTALLGERPLYPETGYGYIEVGAPSGVRGTFRVRRFIEKPTHERAVGLVASTRYWWNTGVYVWKIGTLVSLFRTHAPVFADGIEKLTMILRARPSATHAIDRAYRALPRTSIDRAVAEKQDAKTIFVATGSYGWNDVGHWDAWRVTVGKRHPHIIRRGRYAEEGCTGTFVYMDAPLRLGLSGLDDVIVVAMNDRILICRAGSSQHVKDLVNALE